jgi:hypothetical protein
MANNNSRLVGEIVSRRGVLRAGLVGAGVVGLEGVWPRAANAQLPPVPSKTLPAQRAEAGVEAGSTLTPVLVCPQTLLMTWNNIFYYTGIACDGSNQAYLITSSNYCANLPIPCSNPDPNCCCNLGGSGYPRTASTTAPPDPTDFQRMHPSALVNFQPGATTAPVLLDVVVSGDTGNEFEDKAFFFSFQIDPHTKYTSTFRRIRVNPKKKVTGMGNPIKLVAGQELSDTPGATVDISSRYKLEFSDGQSYMRLRSNSGGDAIHVLVSKAPPATP